MRTFRQWLEMIQQEPFGGENTAGRRELVVMVGPPAIGKSTYVAAKYQAGTVVTVSRDDIVDAVARSLGLTYDDMFDNQKPLVAEGNKEINRRLEAAFKGAGASGKHVVVDMTHMNPGSRRKALRWANGQDFFKRAVVFTMEESDLPALIARMKDRAEKVKQAGGSKTIGEPVLMNMIRSFQQVTPEEGFDKVDSFSGFQRD